MARNVVTDAAASSASRSRSRAQRPMQIPSSSSFHAGDPFPTSFSPYTERPAFLNLRRQSTYRYHTFPTPPPKTPIDRSVGRLGDTGSLTRSESLASYEGYEPTPLPRRQLGLLALLSIAEQTALNSFGPYLPVMVSSFPEIPQERTGLYVGLLASAFALAQLATNLLWGHMSDRLGRKPVMLLGTGLLAVCFLFVGFCKTYVQLMSVQVAMGLLNGNAAVVPTCLGEVTDRSNQSRAFTWLPIIYSLGGITGPALGGLLVGDVHTAVYPFLAPNMFSAALLIAGLVVLAVWFDETLEGADKKPMGATLRWIEKFLMCKCSSGRKYSRSRWSSRWPQSSRGRAVDVWTADDESEDGPDGGPDGEQSGPCRHDDGNAESDPKSLASSLGESAFGQLANVNTLTVLATYLVFQLSNMSYNSLYPIYASAPPPTGRALSPSIIGSSLSLAAIVTTLFQAIAFPSLKARIGNLGTYRSSLLGMGASMALMPFLGYVDGRPFFGLGEARWWLYAELNAVLVLKNICAVAGLSSVMLLITNSARSHKTLGTLNGVAQTLSAAGRSVGPFLSGGLFTLSTRLRDRAELLVWWVFAAVAIAGWLGALFIRGAGLESGDWTGDMSDEEAAEGGGV